MNYDDILDNDEQVRMWRAGRFDGSFFYFHARDERDARQACWRMGERIATLRSAC